eukprot:scaffold433_cov153-Isochrysis_galbana.AAC.2
MQSVQPSSPVTRRSSVLAWPPRWAYMRQAARSPRCVRQEERPRLRRPGAHPSVKCAMHIATVSSRTQARVPRPEAYPAPAPNEQSLRAAASPVCSKSSAI